MLKIGVFAALFLSCYAAAAQGPAIEISERKVLGTANGRFVFGQISDARRDQFMLDTQTGRLWQIVESTIGEGENTQKIILLEPKLYELPSGKYAVQP